MDIVFTACCQRKRPGDKPEPVYVSRLSSLLTPAAFQKLLDCRRWLSQILKEVAGTDVGFDSTLGPDLLPAWQRYSGNLYRAAALDRSKPETWRRSWFILSALYGVVHPLDLIRNYNVSMKERLPNGTTVSHLVERLRPCQDCRGTD